MDNGLEKMKIITAPDRTFRPGPYEDCLFMAGGISGCGDWQTDFIKQMEGTGLVLFNPRRENFDLNDPTATAEQIDWEFDYIKYSDIISFWFPCETLCPITLFELGKATRTHSQLFVGVHPEYSRRIDIEHQLRCERPDVKIVYSLEDLVKQVKEYEEDFI